MALSVSALPTIHGQFEYQARKTPNAIALVDTGCVKKSSSKPELRNFDEDKEAFVDEETKPSQLTYEDLDSRTNQLAHYLIKQGVKPGAAVGVYIEPSSAHVITVLAVLKAGGVCVLMDPEHHANEQLKDMMEKSQATLAIAKREKLPKLEEAVTSSVDAPKQLISFEDIQLESQKQPTTSHEISVDPKKVAYIVSTSGTTSKPKFIPICHEGITKWLAPWVTVLGMGQTDKTAFYPPTAFDAGLWDETRALLTGGELHTLTVEERNDPNLLIERINKNRITTITVTPDTLARINPAKILHPVKFVSTGDAFKPEIIENFLKNGHKLFNGYGPTEVGIGATIYPVTKVPKAGQPVPIGRCIPHNQFWYIELEEDAKEKDKDGLPNPRVFNSETNVTGEFELGISGSGLMSAYLGLEEKTGASKVFALTPDKIIVYRTGDLVKRDKDGLFYTAGRLKHVAKLGGGGKVNTKWPEQVLLTHSRFNEARVAVVIRKNTSGRQYLACYYQLKTPDEKLSLSELRHFLRQQLPEYAIPSIFVLVKELPLTPKGTVAIDKLPSIEEASILRDTPVTQPRSTNNIEKRLQVLIAEMVGLHPNQIGIKDKLTEELGLKSFMLIDLLTEIGNERTGYDIRISFSDLIIQHNTIELLASLIRAKLAKQNISAYCSDLAATDADDDTPPLFCVYDITGKTDAYIHLKKYITSPIFGLNTEPTDEKIGYCTSIQEKAAYLIEVMRFKQPRGPYCLMGYSFGSALTFEMARQLEARGEQVAHLFLIDAPPPSVIKALSNNDYANYFGNTLKKLNAYLKLDFTDSEIDSFITQHKNSSHKDQITSIFSIIIEATKAKSGKSLQVTQLEAMRINFLAAENYEPSNTTSLKCPTTLYHTKELQKRFPELEEKWMECCNEDNFVTTSQLRRDHFSIMSEPQRWAPDVKIKIQQLKRRGSSASDSEVSRQKKEQQRTQQLEQKIDKLQQRLDQVVTHILTPSQNLRQFQAQQLVNGKTSFTPPDDSKFIGPASLAATVSSGENTPPSPPDTPTKHTPSGSRDNSPGRKGIDSQPSRNRDSGLAAGVSRSLFGDALRAPDKSQQEQASLTKTKPFALSPILAANSGSSPSSLTLESACLSTQTNSTSTADPSGIVNNFVKDKNESIENTVDAAPALPSSKLSLEQEQTPSKRLWIPPCSIL